MVYGDARNSLISFNSEGGRAAIHGPKQFCGNGWDGRLSALRRKAIENHAALSLLRDCPWRRKLARHTADFVVIGGGGGGGPTTGGAHL